MKLNYNYLITFKKKKKKKKTSHVGGWKDTVARSLQLSWSRLSLKYCKVYNISDID